MAEFSHDEAVEKTFRSILDALASIDTFSDPTTPTSFVVYAHDSDCGDDGLGPAYSDVVKKFINWMNHVRTRTYSDRHPSGTFAHEMRSNGDLACRDILGNQFCLLPPTKTSAGTDPARPSRVETVIVFGSPRLRSYCQHPFANEYIDKIKTTYGQCRSGGDAELRQRLQDEVLKTSTTQPSFHNVLTEIAFLELRYQHNHDSNNIVWASFGNDDMGYVRFKESSNIHVSMDVSESIAVLRGRFFKLLRIIYTTNSAAIDKYQKGYEGAEAELRKRSDHFNERDLNNLTEKFISLAQRDLIKHRNSELRQLHQRKHLEELGSKEYNDLERRRNKVLGALPTIAYRDRKDRNKERVTGTCRWFTQHHKFQDWQKSETGGILWVTAYPGCGKSVLLKHLVDTVLVAPHSAVCYFFFKDDFEDQKSVVGALRCLLHQIFIERPDLLTEQVVKKFERDQQLLASLSNMWDLLKDITRSVAVGDIIIVIDALDECRQDDRRIFMEQLVKLQKDTAMTRLKVLVSSRLYVDISQGFRKVGSEIHLSAENDIELDQISAEIDLVISHRLQDTAALVELTQEQRDLLYQQLTKVRHKTYLWAYLVLDEIDKMVETDSRSLREAVQNLPHSVDAAYEKILSRSGQREKVMTMLSIIVAAAKPLNLLQLAQAWALAFDTGPEAKLEVASESQIRRTLNGLCGLFVIVVEGKVYLLHQTAREFLLGHMTPTMTEDQSSKPWAGSISMPEADFKMARICLRYFDRHEAPPWTTDDKYSDVQPYAIKSDLACQCLGPRGHLRIDCLSVYAIEHWFQHVNGGQKPDGERLIEQAATVCERLGQTIEYKVAPLEGYKPVGMPGLVVASMLGLLSVVEFLLRSPHADVECTDMLGTTALVQAVHCSRTEVVRVLLEQGADANAKSYGCVPILTYAAFGEDDAIAMMLLDSGANPHAVNSNGETALMEAAEFGTADLVLRLLEHGADIHAVDERGRTAISCACWDVNLPTVRVLLQAGADPNWADIRGQTLLIHCCSSRSTLVDDQNEVVELLLRQDGIDINASDEDGNTALSGACRNVHMPIVQLLLRHGATISAQCFLQAADEGHAALLQILLHAGADASTTDSKGDIALTTAASAGHLDVVKTLLGFNAEVDHANKWGQTALFKAAQKGHREITELLIRYGASVNKPMEGGRTPLMAAIYWGYGEVALTLLANKADTECIDSDGWTALSIAVDRPNTDFVHMLLDHGAHVNHTDDRARPALTMAAHRGAVDLSRFLHQRGADPARIYSGGAICYPGGCTSWPCDYRGVILP